MFTPSDLSERWYIGLGQATQNAQGNHTRLMHSAILLMARWYRADRMFIQPCISWYNLHGTTMNGHCKSRDGKQNMHKYLLMSHSLQTALPNGAREQRWSSFEKSLFLILAYLISWYMMVLLSR